MALLKCAGARIMFERGIQFADVFECFGDRVVDLRLRPRLKPVNARKSDCHAPERGVAMLICVLVSCDTELVFDEEGHQVCQMHDLFLGVGEACDALALDERLPLIGHLTPTSWASAAGVLVLFRGLDES